MASNVFPMLSSSPPPMDDCPDEDEEEEEEFGNFTAANIPFDSSFDSPVAVEKFKSFKSGDNGVNNVNFSDGIHKFNFSNSTTPSPEEFVPDFSNESEHSKNGFKPIRNELSERCIPSFESSTCHTKTEITSHKSVPPVPSEHLEYSYNDSELLASKSCDSQKNIIKNSCVNDCVKGISKDSSSESDSLDEEPIPVCDFSKDTKESNHILHENISGNICDQPTFDSYTTVKLSKSNKNTDKISPVGENCLPSDEFDCSFNFQDSENDIEEFADFQHSEKFALNDEDSSKATLKSGLEDKQRVEFEDFQACGKSMVSAEISEEVRKSSPDIKQTSELDNFQACVENIVSAQTAESSEIILKSEITDKNQVTEFFDCEFDDFQGCGDNASFAQATESSVKSNDDGFQEFRFSDAPDEDAGDFADFQDFNAVNTSDANDFADFSSVSFDSNKISQPSEDNDFADFKEASFSASAETSSQATPATQKSIDTLSTVINAIFPLDDTPQDYDTSDETSPQILEQSNKSRRLWEKLHEVEQAPGLRFQWGVSHSFQQLLRAVNIDYHSILRTSSVPIFASGLSLLEPVKGLSGLANHDSEDRIHTPKDPIPPVEFDWNGSGLVNPLDFGQAASALMDLSFLSSVSNTTNETSNDNSFENELLKPSPAFSCPDTNSQTQILEQLLSKNVSSLPNSKLSRRPSDLSEEAIRVLDQLPDLSFMQAKVLMFPISSKI